jgi:hypothetical protein
MQDTAEDSICCKNVPSTISLDSQDGSVRQYLDIFGCDR